MSYVRDRKTGVLVLKDTARLDQFKQSRGVVERMQALEAEINSLKTEVQTLKMLVESIKESK